MVQQKRPASISATRRCAVATASNADNKNSNLSLDLPDPSPGGGRAMPCFKPLKGYRTPSGKITFNRKHSTGVHAEVPCGQCIGCRLAYAQEWAIRCMHEAQIHDENSFITLTYRDEDLPQHGSLDKTHFQKFLKRFRKDIAPTKIRFYHCGEYGEKLARPHYHALIFGYDFPDKTFWSLSQGKNRNYRSAQLERLWPFGHCIISGVTYQSAAYCARYSIKKIRGQALLTRDPETDLLPYQIIDEITGEIINLQPEYATMSRMPGLGRDWYEKYKDDVFPDDFCVHNGRKVKTPQYYRNILEAEDPVLSGQLALARRDKSDEDKSNQTYERLNVRERVTKAKIKTLTRTYEKNGT